MKKEIALPSKTQLMAFTQSEIDALPNWFDHDKTQLGGFAKKGWLKAKNSLVFIVVKEANTIGYVVCNPYNGYVDNKGYCGGIYEREYAFGGKYYVAQGMVLQKFHHVTENKA